MYADVTVAAHGDAQRKLLVPVITAKNQDANRRHLCRRVESPWPLTLTGKTTKIDVKVTAQDEFTVRDCGIHD